MLRLLYIDLPFEKETGGDRNRSRFLWSVLPREYDVELLLVQRPGMTCVPPTPGPDAPVCWASILPARPGSVLDPASAVDFAPAERARFAALLDTGRFDLVFVRGHGNWRLARAAEMHPARPAVVLDLDFLASRLAESSWRARPWFARCRFLLEKWRCQWLDRRLARRPYLFLFSHSAEAHYFKTCIAMEPTPGRFGVLPNALPPGPPSILPSGSSILFFGRLDAPANEDALHYLVDEIFPLLEPDLRRHGVRLVLAGDQAPAWLAPAVERRASEHLVLLGPVASLDGALAEARFVLLPLRFGAGTRTRVLQAAAHRRAIVATRVGVEGFDLGEDAVVCSSTASFVEAVRALLADPPQAALLGRRLHARCANRHSPRTVAADLVRELDRFAQDHPARSAPGFPGAPGLHPAA